MFSIFQPSKLFSILLIEQTSIVTMLSVTLIFFVILLVLGIIKSAKLKAENERLNRPQSISKEERNTPYKDFREGHLYDNN